MPNRIIKESINESRGLADCSFFAQDLYKRLITYADDYGRFNADTQIMLARLYPRDIDIVTEDMLIDAILELAGIGKVAFYLGTSLHEKQVYGCFPNWKEHQRLRDSKKKCPEPADTSINDWALKRFVPLSMKMALLQRDNFSCQECGKRIAESDNAKMVAKMGAGLFHIDHIVPVAQGGRATMENLRILCPKCNLSRKRYFTFDEILQFAATCRNSPQLAATCSRLPLESESESESEHESESSSDTGFIDDDEAHQIQHDHDRVLDAAKDAGFKGSNSENAALLRFYADFGLEKVLEGINACVEHSAPNIAYLGAVLKGNSRKPSGSSSGKVLPAQNFQQRDYSKVDAEIMANLQKEMAEYLKDHPDEKREVTA